MSTSKDNLPNKMILGELVNSFLIKKHSSQESLENEIETIVAMKNKGYSPEEILESIGIDEENFEPEMVFSPIFTDFNHNQP
jgi:hypothetical protein